MDPRDIFDLFEGVCPNCREHGQLELTHVGGNEYWVGEFMNFPEEGVEVSIWNRDTDDIEQGELTYTCQACRTQHCVGQNCYGDWS